MTQPSDSLITRLRAANKTMADRNTAHIRNEWYCAGFAHEFDQNLLKRKLLGRDIVFYRSSSGEVVALDDRCAHRSFPLSAGKLVDDHIVCAYHGFCYDTNGDCIRVPSQATPPRNIGVRNYPVKQTGRIVWIWMGGPDLAKRHTPPEKSWLIDPDWHSLTGYMHLAANYVSLHENLLDLSHIEFLHAATLGLGAPGLAGTPTKITNSGDDISVERHVEPAALAPVFASTTGLGEISTAARVSRTEFISPAFEEVSATFFDGSLPVENRSEFTVRTAHLITPETQTTTHYFIDHTWNWPIDDPAMRQLMHDGLFAAFAEDVVGLQLVERSLEARSDDVDFYETSVRSDAAAVAMRRLLFKRALAERAPEPA